MITTEYRRSLNLKVLLNDKSHFLFGPRSVGKTTLIEQQLSEYKRYDLLDNETFDRLIRRPKVIEEELTPRDKIIVIDEIQKIPKILDTIQRIVQKTGTRVLLTGSSARKLKRGGANLLGGRAWEAHLFPLTWGEITDFDLIQYLNRGGIPHIYLSKHYERELAAYLSLYIKEEIIAEAQLRKVDQFIRFLDVIGLQNGEELHFQGIASDTGIPAVTIQTYIELLQDTLIGYEVNAFKKTKKRKAITRSKFYLFDIGVVNKLAKRGEVREGSELFGKAFEHFIMNEIRAALHYSRTNENLCYWRSKDFEVDAIIGDRLAIEIKSTSQVHEGHLKGLKALREEGLVRDYVVVSNDLSERKVDGIRIMPYPAFLKMIWKF